MRRGPNERREHRRLALHRHRRRPRPATWEYPRQLRLVTDAHTAKAERGATGLGTSRQHAHTLTDTHSTRKKTRPERFGCCENWLPYEHEGERHRHPPRAGWRIRRRATLVSICALVALFVTPAAVADPPVLTGVPGDQVLEAESSAGASFSWPDPTATDPEGNPTTVECSPPSGTTFPIATTTVTCTATDTVSLEETSQSFTVTVQDTTPPTVTVPGSITTEATGPAAQLSASPPPRRTSRRLTPRGLLAALGNDVPTGSDHGHVHGHRPQDEPADVGHHFDVTVAGHDAAQP